MTLAAAFVLPIVVLAIVLAVVVAVVVVVSLLINNNPGLWSRDAARLLDRLQRDDMVRPMIADDDAEELDRLVKSYYRKRNNP